MNPRTIFASIITFAAFAVAIVLGSLGVDGYWTMAILIFFATSSTFILAYWLAPIMLFSMGIRLLGGAVIPVVSLLLICVLQNTMWASDCNRNTQYSVAASAQACSAIDTALLAFIFLAPVLAVFGAVLAVVTAYITKRLTLRSSSLPPVAGARLLALR